MDGHEVSCGLSAFSAGPASESAAPASTGDRRAESPLAQIGATRARRAPSFGRDWTELCLGAAGGHRLGPRSRHENPIGFRGPPPPLGLAQSPAGPVRRRACKRALFPCRFAPSETRPSRASVIRRSQGGSRAAVMDRYRILQKRPSDGAELAARRRLLRSLKVSAPR